MWGEEKQNVSLRSSRGGILQCPRHHLAEGREAALTLDLCSQERSSRSTATSRERPLSVNRVYRGSPSHQTTTPGPTARAAGTVTPVRWASIREARWQSYVWRNKEGVEFKARAREPMLGKWGTGEQGAGMLM